MTSEQKAGEGSAAPSLAHSSPNDNVTTAREVHTFFSAMESSFVQIKEPSESNIETAKFLACCRSVLPVFNILGGTVFAPIKADIQGNIDKLNEKYNTDKKSFARLMVMLQKEVDEGRNATSGRALEAALWLKRALEFILSFLSEIHSGNDNLADCTTKAYNGTLKRYHSWFVQKMFAFAVLAMPSMRTFKRDLAPSPKDASHPDYTKQLHADCGEYVAALRSILETINQYYKHHNLEPSP
ncbi:pleckstrin homology domain-containing family A member 8 [Dermacentor silvarum]|uniref:pleckstrin homology domain-containing family A member 8 n=1 Tax=Dermacentor silvarum TaxID=543639 RepID=UPI0018975358|nr:pleckstrin homology domain-containing family A member 8 [Dermacentor silvarum]XP_049524082.1 pleckstrin homology domain-containing family A member 8 [Dermacentor silvarum]